MSAMPRLELVVRGMKRLQTGIPSNAHHSADPVENQSGMGLK